MHAICIHVRNSMECVSIPIRNLWLWLKYPIPVVAVHTINTSYGFRMLVINCCVAILCARQFGVLAFPFFGVDLANISSGTLQTTAKHTDQFIFIWESSELNPIFGFAAFY